MSKPSPVRHKIVRRFGALAAIIAFCLILAFVGVQATFLLDQAPYRMVLTPSQDHAQVQFFRLDRGLSTAQIPVEVKVDRVWIVDLTGDPIAVPGVTVEFHDTFPLPGIFRLRIGGVKIVVEESCYYVNGEQKAWKERSMAATLESGSDKR